MPQELQRNIFTAGIPRGARLSHLRVELPEDQHNHDATASLALLQSGFRYAMSLAHHREDAEDLAQEAWMKLCRRYGGALSKAAFFTVIRNLFIDRCRRARVIAFDSWDATPPGLAAPEGIAPGTIDDLERLLGKLRPGEREAIYLHHVEGYTAEEIGAVTRQPRGTVLSLLHRALQKLRTAAAVCPASPPPVEFAIKPGTRSSTGLHG